MSAPRRYSVVVAKDYLKFAAAHFIAYPGFREPAGRLQLDRKSVV